MVIDNSRQDTLRNVVLSCGAKYQFIGQNLGFGAGHNRAIKAYENFSEYHLILNPDVSFGPKVLPHLYSFLQSNPAVGMVMPRVLYPDGKEQLLCKLLPRPLDLVVRRFGGPFAKTFFKQRLDNYLLAHADMSRPRLVPCVSGCFMLVKAALFRQIGYFDERFFMYMEDVDLCRRAGEVSDVVYVPSVSIHHEYSKGSYYDPNLLKSHLMSACKYFSKWGWITDPVRDALNSRTLLGREVEQDYVDGDGDLLGDIPEAVNG